jgi:anti-anti-sigma regulatory factor
VHRDAAEYHRRLATFFAEGLRDGRRVAYVGYGDVAASRADLAGVRDLDRLLAEGMLHVLSAQDVYGPGGPVDPERVLATYALATEAALADGFRGLTVAADATDLVRSPAQQEAFARYEFLVDCYMASHPLSALCGYRLELGKDTVTDFAALHAAGLSRGAPFRVFGCPDGAIGLAGRFDPVSVAALGRVLARLRPGAGTGALVVDLAGVEYLDHRLLLALGEYARKSGVSPSLRSVSPFGARLLELLSATHLRHAEVGAKP